MFNQVYYFGIIRKYVTLFGTLFDSISIVRTNSAGHMTEFIKVPVTYSPKEKMLARVGSDPNLDRQTATPTLPLMAFEMTNIQYDPDRKLGTVRRVSVTDPTDPNSLKYQFVPVPYNIGFRLSVMVKNAEDGTKIIEQILPYFTPDWTTTVQLIPEMDISHEIPIVLDNIQQEDAYSGDFKERQALTWTLDFTLKGFIYGPIRTGKIIKFANTVFYVPENVGNNAIANYVGNTDPAAFLQAQPGLTPNGQPTANASLSIDPNLITATTDFGYVSNNTNVTANNVTPSSNSTANTANTIANTA
jgi:hypothetical protein